MMKWSVAPALTPRLDFIYELKLNFKCCVELYKMLSLSALLIFVCKMQIVPTLQAAVSIVVPMSLSALTFGSSSAAAYLLKLEM